MYFHSATAHTHAHMFTNFFLLTQHIVVCLVEFALYECVEFAIAFPILLSLPAISYKMRFNIRMHIRNNILYITQKHIYDQKKRPNVRISDQFNRLST